MVRRDIDELRIAANLGHGEHAIPRLKIGDFRAYLAHNARWTLARREGQLGQELILARDDDEIDEIHRRCAHLDEHFMGRDRRTGDVGDLRVLIGSEGAHHNRLHSRLRRGSRVLTLTDRL